jgi:hypothetical protein
MDKRRFLIAERTAIFLGQLKVNRSVNGCLRCACTIISAAIARWLQSDSDNSGRLYGFSVSSRNEWWFQRTVSDRSYDFGLERESAPQRLP